MPRDFPETGKVMTFSCECGKDEFKVTIGASLGWGEIREVTRTCTDPKTGVVEEVAGMLIHKRDGSMYWLDYPVDPFRPFEEHGHEEPGFEGEDGG